jgi:hypothetical protein
MLIVFCHLEAKLSYRSMEAFQSMPVQLARAYFGEGSRYHCVTAFREWPCEAQRRLSGTACSKACNDVSNEYLVEDVTCLFTG